MTPSTRAIKRHAGADEVVVKAARRTSLDWLATGLSHSTRRTPNWSYGTVELRVVKNGVARDVQCSLRTTDNAPAVKLHIYGCKPPMAKIDFNACHGEEAYLLLHDDAIRDRRKSICPELIEELRGGPPQGHPSSKHGMTSGNLSWQAVKPNPYEARPVNG